MKTSLPILTMWRCWTCINNSAGSAIMLLCLAALCLSGCSSPFAVPSPLMVKSTAPAGPVPADKALVLIHRPRAFQGYGLYTTIWDRTSLLADLGNGQSIVYSCDPGQHLFINRSVERVGVVEAHLSAAQTYDLRLDTA